MEKYIRLETFLQAPYHKCECCSRVRDIYFRANVYDYDTKTLLVGSFEMCQECGENMGKIIGQKLKSDAVVTDFSFEQ